MDWWNNALQAAEKGLLRAKEMGKKGLEVVEATAEEANRKLQLNLHDKVGAGGKAPSPSPAQLEAFGLTQEFADWVRTLNYSAFREFPADHLLPTSGAGGDEAAGSSGGAGEYKLNPWQVRHATLVVQALKEVNELRFVLCPKYMTDEHFWHVYFTLARKHLPDAAYSWGPDDALPTFEDEAGDAFSLTSLSSQLKQLGSKLQSASASGRQRAGLELSNLVSSVRGDRDSPGSATAAAAAASSSPLAEASGAAAGTAAGAAAGVAAGAAAGEAKAPPAGMLEEDPDLEAYLQVAISGSAPGSTGGDEFGGEDDEDDLDLDSYINELSAEVEAAAAAQADGDAAAAAEAAAEAAAGQEVGGEAAAETDAAGTEAEQAAAPAAGKESKKD